MRQVAEKAVHSSKLVLWGMPKFRLSAPLTAFTTTSQKLCPLTNIKFMNEFKSIKEASGWEIMLPLSAD